MSRQFIMQSSRQLQRGLLGLNDITTKVGEENSVVAKYLKNVDRPWNRQKGNADYGETEQKTIYLLADNFFRFGTVLCRSMQVPLIRGESQRPTPCGEAVFSGLYGPDFEKMCQDYLLYYANDLPIELSEIGQWWGTDPQKKKQIQIDIVGTPVEAMDIYHRLLQIPQ